MKKLIFAFFVFALMLNIGAAFADQVKSDSDEEQPNVKSENLKSSAVDILNPNALVFTYDDTNQDLIAKPIDFPIYFLLNFSEVACQTFPQDDLLVVTIAEDAPTVTKVTTKEKCQSNSAFQVKGDFRKITQVSATNPTLQTLDEAGNTHEIKLGPGCEKATNLLDQEVYLGTGWNENTLILPQNQGTCEILSSTQLFS